jgi:TRAP-type transport system periplasmic protein
LVEKQIMRILNSLVAIALVLAHATLLAQPQFTMKLSTPTIGDVNVEWMKAFKKGVEERTGGKLQVELYPGSQLGSMARTVDGVLLGTIEAAFVSSGFLVGVEPRYQVFDAIGIFDDLQHGQRIFSDPEVRKRLAGFGASKGFQPLTTIVHSPNVIVARKPLQGLDGLKGMKIRTYPSPLQMDPLRRFGASPVPMTLGDVLPALQNGTLDGALTANTILTALKYQDTARHALYLPSWPTVAAAIVNKAWLAKLPAEFRTILEEEARKADAVAVGWGSEEVERSRALFARSGGINVELPEAERRRFVDEVTQVLLPAFERNAQVKEDYQAFLAAARRARRP